jgi:ABC-type hemin transport system substrate-binding protein
MADVPQRIVSLVPSLTELVAWLGRAEALVGRTRFCVEPAEVVARVAIVGGTKNPRVKRIVALAPDLVLANKEENRREDVEALQAAGLQVAVTDPDTVEEAVRMIGAIGRLLGTEGRAESLCADIRGELRVQAAARPRVFVPVWWEPLMGLGSMSYGHDLLERAGAVNVLRERPRYPEVTLEVVAALKPDLVLLPDEPFPFKDAHRALFRDVAPATVVDGKLLWWYGPRIPQALRTLRALFATAPA